MSYQNKNDRNPQAPLDSQHSERTAAFLATEHSARTLHKISNLDVPVEDLDEDERKMLVESKYNPKTYQSIRVDNEKDTDDSGAWYNSDGDDPTIGEFITVKTVFIGICWLASCGMLGYYLLKGYYMLKK